MSQELETLLHDIRKLYPCEIDLDLSRTLRLLRQLNHPEKVMKNIVHVAGTNGKGSTLAFLHTLLTDCGYTVNKYISPHLSHFCERICIDQWKNLSLDEQESKIIHGMKIVKDINRDGPITMFEFITCTAFYLFYHYPCDYTLLETGLGGRLDATNCCETPLVTAITSIGMDHTDILGKTLGAIAFEKAGIIKPGVPIVVPSNMQDEAMDVIADVAAQRNAPLIIAEPCTKEMSLIGAHQQYNAGIAITLFNLLKTGNPLNYESLKRVQWRGRYETIHLAGHDILIDGAHNVESIRALSNNLTQLHAGAKFIIFLHIKTRKFIDEMIQILLPHMEAIYWVNFPVEGGESPTYAQFLRYLQNRLGEHTLDKIRCLDSLDDIATVYKEHPNHEFLATGSLFWVGTLLKEQADLNERYSQS